MAHIVAEPFRPFRIHTANGRDFEVRHPEVVQVGETTLTISIPMAGDDSMALIKCGVCEAVFESNVPACPICGRCPNCGDKRVKNRELAENSVCTTCGVPYCSGCGRCHHCGTLRVFELDACQCGFPGAPETIQRVEKAFGLQGKRKSWNPFW